MFKLIIRQIIIIIKTETYIISYKASFLVSRLFCYKVLSTAQKD